MREPGASVGEEGPGGDEASKVRASAVSDTADNKQQHLLGGSEHILESQPVLLPGLGRLCQVCQGQVPADEFLAGTRRSSCLVDRRAVLSGRACGGSHGRYRAEIVKTSQLTRATRALNGFKKMAPGHSRVPLPYLMLALIALHIFRQSKDLLVCIWLLLTWHLCARPSEALKLQWQHVIAPNKINPKWSVVMSPSSETEGMGPSKIGVMDESVTLDVEFLQWMSPILQKLKSQGEPSAAVFGFPLAHGTKLFNQAVDELGFRRLGVQCPYQIRHGAASTEVLCRKKSLEEVMKKGRWQTLTSVRRYEQGSRLAQVFGLLSAKEQQACVPGSRARTCKHFGSLGWVRKARPGSLFLELFGAKDPVGKAVQPCMKQKLVSVPVGSSTGGSLDLEKRTLQRFVLHLLRSGKVAGAWLGTPDRSWAATRPGREQNSRMLRSADRLRGLDHLSEKGQALVKSGNNRGRFCISLFKTCEQMGVPVVLAGPATSLFWLLPQVRELAAKETVHLWTTDYCQAQCKWRRRTRLLASSVDLGECTGLCSSKQGICDQTCKPHFHCYRQHEGKRIGCASQAPPSAFCKRVAKAFSSAIFEYWARPMMQILGFHHCPDTAWAQECAI